VNTKTLEKKIRKARVAYYNGEPIMSDKEFDELMDHLRNAAPTSRVLKEVGAKPMGTTGKHSIPMGSLKEAKTPEEMESWMKGIKRGFLVMAKVDGLSLSLDYRAGMLVQALTRGNGREGEEVTANVLEMQNVLEEIPGFDGTLRGEAYLPVATFKEKYEGDYANPRNTCAGIVRRHSGEGSSDVHLAYFFLEETDRFFATKSEMLARIKELGLKTVDSFKTKGITSLWHAWNGVVKTRYERAYEMDGIVVYVDRVGERDPGDPFLPDDAFVYKFNPDVAETQVTEIEHVAGRSGRVNPRVHVEPVKVGGVTVTHATGNNYPWLKNLGVGVGALVEISRRGDTIPAVEKVLKAGAPLVIPGSCPACKSVLERDGAYLKCKNLACEAKDSGSVAHWLRLIELKGVGKRTLEKLVEMGVRRPYQLYNQRFEFWQEFGANGRKVFQQLMLKKTVKPEYILAAHVPNVGRRRFRALIDAGFSIDHILLNRSPLAYTNVDGIGEEMVKTIDEGMKQEAANIQRLLNHVNPEVPMPKGGNLDGWAVKFTGKMTRKRNDLEDLAMEKGARIGWQKGKKNVLIIADPNSTSTKAQAARKAGHEIMSEEQFLAAAGEAV